MLMNNVCTQFQHHEQLSLSIIWYISIISNELCWWTIPKLFYHNHSQQFRVVSMKQRTVSFRSFTCMSEVQRVRLSRRSCMIKVLSLY